MSIKDIWLVLFSHIYVIAFYWSVAIIYFAIKVFLSLFLLYSWFHWQLNFKITKPLLWGDIYVYANIYTWLVSPIVICLWETITDTTYPTNFFSHKFESLYTLILEKAFYQTFYSKKCLRENASKVITAVHILMPCSQNEFIYFLEFSKHKL